MATIFSKIIAGEIPSYKVAENADFYAFLDINPLNAGHTLVIPKREVDYIFDLTEDEYAAMNRFAYQVANAIKQVIPCKRIATAVIGMEVPHAHIHLVPINAEGDLNFTNARYQATSEQMQQIAQDIQSKL